MPNPPSPLGKRKIQFVSLAGNTSPHWLKALANSIEQWEPGADLAIIPFDGNVPKLVPITQKWSVRFWEPFPIEFFDKIGRFMAQERCPPGYYRKLAAFFYPADWIIYVDTDVVLNGSLTALIDAIEAEGADFVYHEVKLDMACNPGPVRDRLVKENGLVGFNSGFFIVRGGLLNQENLQGFVDLAASYRGEIEHLDQGFINFIAAMAGWKQRAIWQIFPDLCRENWASFQYLPHGDRHTLVTPDFRQENCVVLVLHWAGYKAERHLPNLHFWIRYRFLHHRPLIRPLARFAWTLRYKFLIYYPPTRRRIASVFRKLGAAALVDKLRTARG